MKAIEDYFHTVSTPLILVSTIPQQAKEAVASFLEQVNAPIYLEGVSGLREEPHLQSLRVKHLDCIGDLPIDGIFRIGGVPTHRIWRDLEAKKGELSLLSFSHLPWPGASWGEVVVGDYEQLRDVSFQYPQSWYTEPFELHQRFCELSDLFPKSEPAVMRMISSIIPDRSLVYLGNSLPIREWDLAAVDEMKHLSLYASRGMNGIDGQMSTFLGMTQPYRSNWCILGDLTALYDLSAPWILPQLEPRDISIVVINNGGGMIFSRMSDRECLQNKHEIGFEYFAKMWNIDYYREEGLALKPEGARLIEVVPCAEQTNLFWERYASLFKTAATN